MTHISRIDPNGLYRAKSIVRCKANPTPLIDVSLSTWWAGVKSGRFPQPVRMGSHVTLWRGMDLLGLVWGSAHGLAA